MSSPKVRNKSVEIIGNSEKEPEKCGIERASRLPKLARSSTVSGRKTKILGNVSHIGRPSVVQTHENPRLFTNPASDVTNVDGASPINSGRRATSRSATSTSHPPTSLNSNKTKASITPVGNSAVMKKQMESQFAMKKKRYATLKKELTERQKSASDLYVEMSQLRDKLIASGAKDPGKIETINLAGSPLQPCTPRFTADSHALRGSGEQVFAPNSAVTSELVTSLETKLRQLPDQRSALCEELSRKRSEILQHLAQLSQKKDETNVESEIAKTIEIYEKESSELATRVEETKKMENDTTNEIIEKISMIWHEVEVSRGRIRELEITSEEIARELRVKVESAENEKKIKTDQLEIMEERKRTLEMELEKSKVKIRTMEARASEDETKIAGLLTNVKNLESLVKQKECGGEQRLKEMQKSLRNSEILLAKTERQRDNFESRMNELKKDLASKESEAEAKIKEMSKKLEAATAKFDKTIEDYKRQKGNFACGESMMEDQLAERDEKIATLQRKNDDIIRVIRHELLADGSDVKIEGDGNSHETIVSALVKKMQTLRANLKITRDRNENFQAELLELHSRMEVQSNESGKGKSFWTSQVNDLRQEILDLRCRIGELTRCNEELEVQLNRKQLEFEEQERAMREQSRILKVRDEVIGLLKEKPDVRMSCEGGHLAVAKKKNSRDREQVDRQIAEKTENLQQLYSTLEAKQMQITRLEQLVQKMELQQDRAQEQRTRLEKKIGQLQFAMHYKTKNQRSRGFSIL